jgi:hypothetical protein
MPGGAAAVRGQAERAGVFLQEAVESGCGVIGMLGGEDLPQQGGSCTHPFDIAGGEVARATLTSVIACTAQGMLTACVPLLGERVPGGAGRGAMLFSCTAVSALVANAVLARFPRSVAPDTIIWASALVQAVALALATWSQPVVLIMAAAMVGIGEGPQLAALFAIRHREAPERLRGQIFTTGASLKITGFALGAAVAGPFAVRSLPGALALAASVAALGALAFFTIPSTTADSPERSLNLR